MGEGQGEVEPIELFNPSKKMTRRGRHVQRGWYPLVLQTAYPHRSLSYTHTKELNIEFMLLKMKPIDNYNFHR